jgi:uncharacterized membrane protein
MTGSIAALALAALAFVGGHFILSHPLRAPLIRRLGALPFAGLYSLLVGLAFAWMLLAYGKAPYIELWGKAEWFRWPLVIIMLPISIMVVAGLTSPNPALFMSEGALKNPGAAHGIFAVTRHPMNLGFGIWGLGHLVMNGDLATIILAGSIAILGIGGSWAQEQRKAAELGEAWKRYEAVTSFVPFAAIAAGRARFSPKEIGYWRLAGGLVLWAALLHLHHYITGANPIPM